MSAASVLVLLDGAREAFRPGETLAGEYRVSADEAVPVDAVELSVMWYTEGQGDEDLGVHHFRRWGPDPPLQGRFEVALPATPLSYDGVLIKVRWCVRVRAFLAGGRERIGEAPFRLGETRPAVTSGGASR
jgi:hypothetical protein